MLRKNILFYSFLIFILLLSIFLILICISIDADALYPKFLICREVGCPDVGNVICATIIVREGGNSYGVACFQNEFNF